MGAVTAEFPCNAFIPQYGSMIGRGGERIVALIEGYLMPALG